MKILFLENRYKTNFWSAIADRLEKNGHTVYWLVQNTVFNPQCGIVHKLPYYRGEVIFEKVYSEDLNKIIKSDRGLNYYGIESDNYIFFYYENIEKVFLEVAPDVVFGESTLFHELLAITISKKYHIPYLHPSSCRYPTGRFCFYKYDTLDPFCGSGEFLPRESALELFFSIKNRVTKPSYVTNVEKLSIPDIVLDKLRLISGYILGERFNTPSIIRKITNDFNIKRNLKILEKCSTNLPEKNPCVYILYAMQMQPEANIDTWGSDFRDQTEVVRNLLKVLRQDERLIIKTNPNPKFEVSKNFLELIKQNREKLILLNTSISMKEVFDYSDLVVSVTGTVAIECLMSDKPLILMGNGLRIENYKYIVDKEHDFRKYLDLFRNGEFETYSDENKIIYLQTINRKSFRGEIGDGLHQKSYLKDSTNMENVITAFENVLNSSINFNLEK